MVRSHRSVRGGQVLVAVLGIEPVTSSVSGKRSPAGTQRAVQSFQKDRGLVVDGIVGPDT
ncbi:peptidoglycan-binding protein, partial [Streptomyces sp. YC504]